MKNEFVPYELALRLKKIGFDEPCLAWFAETKELQIALETYKKWTSKPCNNSTLVKVFNVDCVAAPTFSQAFRWFRENHNLNYWVQNATACWVGYVGNVPPFVPYIEEVKGPNKFNGFDTYEEAELSCLEKLIEIVEQK